MTSNNLTLTANNSYSQALYELAVESKDLSKVEDEVNAIIKLISENPDFKNLIKDPTIKKNELLQVITTISKKFNISDIFNKFLCFLVNKARMYYLEKILKDFLIISSNKKGEIIAKLKAAKKMNDDEINNIKKDLTENFGSNLKLNFEYDPSLIGGLIIQIGSIMIDTSIKSKLHKLETKMIEA